MSEDLIFKHKVVEEILNKRPEQAVKMLSEKYNVKPPNLYVGVVKGKSTSALGVYIPKKKTIYVRNSDILFNPFVIIHEFYHHLRTRPTKHRGTEKYADRFAQDFIKAHLIIETK
tara:strand:- start:677 stop:1021 length:345 start_codon:yes stop_codon:yes gene_type:complete